MIGLFWMIAYIVIAIVWFVVSLVAWAESYDDVGEKQAARAALLAPLWPLGVLAGFLYLLAQLIRSAVGR